MSAKKSRFDGLDVAAMTSHIKRTMLGFKLANIYDGNALGVSGTASGGGSDAARGVYMFKLADPSGGGGATTPATAASSGEQGRGDDNAAAETTDGVTEQPTAAQDQKRAMLLIESGVRFHPTT